MTPRRLPSLPAPEAAAAARRGQLLLVDLREPGQLDERIPGAVSVPFSALAESLAALDTTTVAFVCRTGRLAAMAAVAARRAGIDAYFVDGGLRGWRQADGELESPKRPEAGSDTMLTPQGAWDGRGDAEFVDLRDRRAYERRRVPGARSIPLSELSDHLPMLENVHRTVVFLCVDGNRSRVAAELLKRRGRASVAYVRGGLLAWDAQGLPLVDD